MSRVAHLPLLLLVLLLREVRYVAAAVVVGSSRRKPRHENRLYIRSSCSMSPREILVVINWLDLYTLESARGGRCYQLLPWYHPYTILLLLSCLLRCVVRYRVVCDFMRADGDYFDVRCA